ncbi:glycoside hydrolase superfamily, partial [Mycena rosella]
TEQDIATITGTGLNWVRVPIPFWAIRCGFTLTSSPPQHIVRLFGWAHKYGILVNLDLHTAPGSQNGECHSGKLGQINFLGGVMGYANVQHMLDYICFIIEFILRPEDKDRYRCLAL